MVQVLQLTVLALMLADLCTIELSDLLQTRNALIAPRETAEAQHRVP